MKIAVTGAAGHLGSTICDMLIKEGMDDIIGIDVKENLSSLREKRKADLSRLDQAVESLKGAEVIIHCASIHPLYKYTHEQYLDFNVKGTWNVYSAAKELGIKKIVLTSSIAASGLVFPTEMWPVREDLQLDPEDIYSYTKYCQEVAAKCFAKVHGIQTLALRPCSFMKREPLKQALTLLGNHMNVQDLVSAHIAALKADIPSRFEAFYITNKLPYTSKDSDIAHDPWLLAERYFSGVKKWFTERGYKSYYIGTVYSLEKAKKMLGWEPVHNFEWTWEEAKKHG
jgi:nucleoside-diphosphate-sugar epimerase